MNRPLVAVVAILSFVAVTTGVDYVTGNSYDMGRTFGDQLVAPYVWGVACLLVGISALVGVIRKDDILAINSAIGGMATYAMFSFQIFETRMLPHPWPPEDLRLLSNNLGLAALWMVVALTLFFRQGVDRKKAALLKEA